MLDEVGYVKGNTSVWEYGGRKFEEVKETWDFVNKIKETFGENILIAYGNWSRSTQMKHFMHIMNKGLRKLIHKKYDTITINECNTSKKLSDENHYA